MLPVILMSLDEISRAVAENARRNRLEKNLSQEGLAERAGVSLGSLKRFERFGAISLENLIRLAVALDAAEGLLGLFERPQVKSIDDLIEVSKKRTRGRKK